MMMIYSNIDPTKFLYTKLYGLACIIFETRGMHVYFTRNIIYIHHQVECATLNQELQDMEARVRRGQKKSPDDANQAIQVYDWL